MPISVLSRLTTLLALVGLVATTPALSASSTTTAPAPAFTYNATSFLLHGEPYVIIGGQMDPQRIPHQYWRDRLSKARAMGLNTVFTYVYWNLLEPEQGVWATSDPQNDIATYFKIAQEEGLHIVLRPGPYICGEREWGGFPFWLSTVPGLTVRDFNAPYLELSKIWLEKLATELRPLQVTEGGPLLMVQVENEYGSYGTNHNYTSAIRDILRANFDIPLYTNDGTEQWTLAGGSVPGVLAEIDGDPRAGFLARDTFITDPAQLGPLMTGEYYTVGFDTWGENTPHTSSVGNPGLVAAFESDMNFVLSASNSISLYMFHGGTSFGLGNGALWENFTKAFVTSYDYGAPLDESGRTTDLYFSLRSVIQQYVPNGSIPNPPENIPLMSIPPIKLSPMASLFDLDQPTASHESPIAMEDLGQGYGLVLYEHQATEDLEGLLLPGDRARDRVLAYVNGIKVGAIDSTYAFPQNLTVSVKTGDKLQLLVENLGRVDYFSPPSFTMNGLLDPHKGIVTDVTIGGKILSGWDMFSLPLTDIPAASKTAPVVTDGTTPVFYTGSFSVKGNSGTDPRTLDTFINIPNGIKGVVWVNDFMLGRYWVVGPQQSLYLPGTILKPGVQNTIMVLELEPTANNAMVAVGQSERIWGNFPDPDYP